ncbi:MAG: UDP-N-acetylmuramate dehydrogenase [Clostridia bacterium]|nr:UDP-N-acetylmuramate dehydrogenase [Clostridia bacterium]
MNAGAYGAEIKDILIETKYLDENGEIKIISNKEHEFEYRNSIFSHKNWIILESSFKIEYGNKEELINILKGNMEKRASSQPLDKPNAGSTFKRGDGFITAKLIDEAGLKGYKIGGAQISEKHAGFVINSDDAKAEDVIKLIEYTKEKVKEKFNVEIETEMIVIGE